MFGKSPFHRALGAPASLALLAAVGVPSLCGSAANADVITAFYNNDWHFSYHINQMPDLDQQRAGLDGNGAMHCVPTATMNLLLYAANHGFPEAAPGAGATNWQSQANHPLGTTLIDTLGQLMQTSFVQGDPFANPPIPNGGGTGAGNADAGLEQWLAQQDNIIWGSHLTAPGFTVNFTNIAKSLIGGNIGTMHYGRYDVVGTAPGNIPIVNRNGGHATTVTRCYRNGDDMEIWVRDPGDSNDSLSQQSPFVNRVWEVTEIFVFVQDNNTPPGAELRLVSALNYNPQATRILIMDSHRAIRPKTGFSFSPSQGTLGVLSPGGFGGGPGSKVLAPQLDVILGATFHPQLHDFLLLAGARVPALHLVNPLTGASEPVPVPGTPAFIKTIGNGDTYLITTDNMLHSMNPAFDIQGSVPLPHDSVPTEEMSLNFSKIEFDAGTSIAGTHNRPPSIVIATMIDRKVMQYPLDLAAPMIHDVPTMLQGDLLDLAIEPATGRVWFCMSSSNTLFGVLWSASAPAHVEMLTDPSIAAPTGVDFDDAGNLYVCGDSQLSVLRRNAAGGWSVHDASPFHGEDCAETFAMMRNSSNFDPAIHDHPSWTNNISPEDLEFGELVPDCYGDLDGNGTVDVFDLLELLAAWGPCAGCPADLDGNAAVDVFDLLELLAGWGPCP